MAPRKCDYMVPQKSTTTNTKAHENKTKLQDLINKATASMSHQEMSLDKMWDLFLLYNINGFMMQVIGFHLVRKVNLEIYF